MSPASGKSPVMTTGHVFIAASLDGYIARADGNIDWLTKYAAASGDTGYNAFMASIDGVVMGRGTFEKVLTFGAWLFEKPVIVLSRTLAQADIPATLQGKARISALAPQALMAALAAEGWKRAYIDGGKLIQSFLKDGLIRDMILTHIPVLLGDGIPLFGKSGSDIALRHVETKSFASGLVQSKYKIA